MAASIRVAWRQPSRRTQRPIGTMSPVSSAIGTNCVGRHHAALGVVPAQQRLHARDAPVVEPHDRLVVELELAAGDGALQVGPQLEPLQHALVHLAARRVR